MVVGHHDEPNVYYVQLLNKDCKSCPKVVNQHQIYDLNRSTPLSEFMDSDAQDDNISVVPSFLARKTNGSNNTFYADLLLPHHYNTRSKLKTATTGMQVVLKHKLPIYKVFHL